MAELMIDDGMKWKIVKFIDEPVATVEKTFKDSGIDKKFITIIDSPGIAIEKSAKKGWGFIKYTGKGLKSTMAKKRKRNGKKSVRK